MIIRSLSLEGKPGAQGGVKPHQSHPWPEFESGEHQVKSDEELTKPKDWRVFTRANECFI